MSKRMRFGTADWVVACPDEMTPDTVELLLGTALISALKRKSEPGPPLEKLSGGVTARAGGRDYRVVIEGNRCTIRPMEWRVGERR